MTKIGSTYLDYLAFLALFLALCTYIPLKPRRKRITDRYASLSTKDKFVSELTKNPYLKRLFPREKQRHKELRLLMKDAGVNITFDEIYALKLMFPTIGFLLFLGNKLLVSYGLEGFMTKFMFISGMTGYFLPDIFLHIAKWWRGMKIKAELPLFIQTIENLSNISNNMDEIILAAAKFTKVLRKPFEKAIDNWSDGPEIALRKAAEELNNQEVDFLVTLLIEAAKDAKTQTDFLKEHRLKLEEFKNADQEVWENTKPYLFTVAVSIPALITIAIWFLPILFNTLEALPF